jgi:paraquat-inducible protein B
MIEPERLNAVITEEGKKVTGSKMQAEIDDQEEEKDRLHTKVLISKGFRAQLKTGNLLTGQLYIDFDFYPDADPAELTEQDGVEVFPTIPVPLKRIVQRVDNILEQVEQVPFAQMGKDVGVVVKDVGAMVEELKGLLKELSSVSDNVKKETLPKVNESLDDLRKTLKGADATMAGMNATFGEDSSLNYTSGKVMNELSMTIRSLRSLLEYLERDPQALILGKEGDKK